MTFIQDLIALPYTTWGPVLYVFIRVVAILGTSPVVGSSVLPPQVRVMLALMVGWFALSLGVPANVPPESMWPLAMIAQVLIGTGIGLIATLIFSLFHIAGAALDAELGFTVAQVFSPLSPAGAESLLANWFDALGTFVFLALGGVQLLVLAAVESFRVIPINVTTLIVGPGAVNAVLSAAQGALLIGVEISAPVMLALLLVDVVGAVLGRVLPQLNVLTFNLPVKMWVGMGLIALAMPMMLGAGQIALNMMGQGISGLLQGI